jgi:transcription elongation factor Elf1
MANVDAHEIKFQCPNCGHDLKQTIGRLKANEHMTCSGCGIGINIDTDRLAKAAEEIQKAIEKSPRRSRSSFSVSLSTINTEIATATSAVPSGSNARLKH